MNVTSFVLIYGKPHAVIVLSALGGESKVSLDSRFRESFAVQTLGTLDSAKPSDAVRNFILALILVVAGDRTKRNVHRASFAHTVTCAIVRLVRLLIQRTVYAPTTFGHLSIFANDWTTHLRNIAFNLVEHDVVPIVANTPSV